jgi:PAS domain S-box-containing protein
MHDDIIDAAMRLADADAASIQFLDPASGRLHLIASRNIHPESAAFWRDMDGCYASTCGRAMRTHGRVAVEDTEADPEMAGSGDLEEYRRSGIRAVQSTPLRAGSGRVVGLISTHWHAPRRLTEQDFTLFDVLARQLADLVERAQTEETLRGTEARFRALAEASPALIWQLDSDGALSYMNARGLDLTGASMDQLRDSGWQGVVHPDDGADYAGAVAHALGTQGAFERRVRLRKSGGGHRWFESHALPWHAADGQFRGLVGISIDVTEAVQAEDALRTADRRKDEFLATLAHELRNPLAPISNALQFLRYPDGQRRADRLMAMVERQVRHMVRLVDDLMEVSRISRGMVELRCAPVTLAAVLESGVETSRPWFEQKQQRLTVEAVDPALMLDADKVRLTQVFANLLNNASKYTAPGGQAWLGAVRVGAEVRVTVRDTGMGIRPEQLPHVFEMFSQPHGRDGHKDGGLGIGLSMVRSLVELHGGTVDAHSGGPGQGSRFVVCLPLHEGAEAGPGQADAAPGAATATLAGCRILVVDDNQDAADSLCQLLAACGADARAVYDGRSAIDTLDSAIPDAIVLDIGMPDMDGYEVAQRIRQDARARGVRLVALSGWGQTADRQRSQACGFDHHLTKPAELDSLLGILSTP